MSMSSHTLAVTSVRWGGDGHIYSSSRDCCINVWDAQVLSRLLCCDVFNTVPKCSVLMM